MNFHDYPDFRYWASVFGDFPLATIGFPRKTDALIRSK